MQGWRISMEDAHTAVLDLDGESPKDSKANPNKLSFFGVFDGHGGDKVALFAGENIHNIIAKQDTFKNGNYNQGLKDGFLATDRAILNGTRHSNHGSMTPVIFGRFAVTNFVNPDPKYEEEVSGCTACVSLIAGKKLYLVRQVSPLVLRQREPVCVGITIV